MSILDITSAVPTELVGAGIAGAVIWWFMTHNDRRLRSIEERMHRAGHEIRKSMELVARSNVLLTIALGTESVKERAQVLMAEIDKFSKESDNDELKTYHNNEHTC